jgi:ABC-type Zn uptake system ZnuABC Zn-binding protein ZnuA
MLLRLLPLLLTAATAASAAAAAPLRVVTTLPDYAVIARAIGGERVSTAAIVHGGQDAHFIRPKPSFVTMVREADLVIGTGLDLELWLPTVIDKAGNTRVRSGQPGFVAAAQGIRLLEKPVKLSRLEGGVHVYGNPHITPSPLNIKRVARNIATGLITNDPAGKPRFEANLAAFCDEVDRRLFGPELVKLLGGKTLTAMAENGTLIPFLKKHDFRGTPLIASLGGWLKKMHPLRGTPVVTYHKNWIYFLKLFGLEEAGTVEPKPGIPPSPQHVARLIEVMRQRKVKILLAANYFDEQKIATVAGRVGAAAVVVPVYVGGAPGIDDYFDLVDHWTDRLLAAGRQKGLAAAR